ncbi:hypothetical protein M8C21_025356 [Ambrosia artemisiifolia]|uniref:Uncharacterized protein n=1 Tax=Ambrosia artemisiifolia TaxID=4212 RepID=A0AAD5BVI3_AMBAR|nr:hypothetical protein M8C21_025356 [Ambrosia artemisiifolia]
MARRLLKNIRKNDIPASTYRPRNQNVKMSSQDLSERFGKMRLTVPSQTDDVMQILGKTKRKKKVTKRTTPKTTSKVDHKFANTSASHSHADAQGFPPAIPNLIYIYIKEIIEIMKNPNYLEDRKLYVSLLQAECAIHSICSTLRKRMPKPWEYNRDSAESLIAGYDTVFAEGGVLWII